MHFIIWNISFQVIEEVFKVSLNPETGQHKNQGAPDLMSIQGLVSDAANKLWLNYVETERKMLLGEPVQLSSQLHSMSSVSFHKHYYLIFCNLKTFLFIYMYTALE